jgi:hypothetical protein
MILEGDSLDYDVLYRAAQSVRTLRGLVCEIGTRKGGSLQYIFKALEQTGKTIVSIDPYGNIDYAATEEFFGKLDYTNDMKHEALSNIYAIAKDSGINYIFINLEDTEFFKRYRDGVPVYDISKTIVNDYALVFFDGPHDVKSIMKELEFFIPRTIQRGVYVFDDIQSYPHDTVENYLFSKGFDIIETGTNNRKKSYRKGD